MGLETTTRVPVSHVLNDTNAHYVFYCDLVGASELGPAAVAGCFLAKAHHPARRRDERVLRSSKIPLIIFDMIDLRFSENISDPVLHYRVQ